MSFCTLPVFLAFLLNRCSTLLFSTCRCILGFSPFSSSLLFGFAVVVLLIKYPELYPMWLRRVNCKILFVYELFASLIFIEIGFCLWSSVESFLFYKIPTFLEQHCFPLGELYIQTVETDVGVSIISNLLAVTFLIFALHTTRMCDFSLLFRTHGIHKFFADAGLTSKLCRHHREFRKESKATSNICCTKSIGDCGPSPRKQGGCNIYKPCPPPSNACQYGAKTLRSGKIFY